MKNPQVWLVGLGLVVAVGCSAPDPGVNITGTRHNNAMPADGTSSGSGTNGTSGGAPSSSGGSGTGSGTGSSSGGGAPTTPPVDAGGGTGGNTGGGGTDAGGGGAATNAFTGAPAYAAKPPGTTAKQSHQNNGVGTIPGKDVACLDCHKTGGAGTPFLMGGWVASAANGTTGVANIEVRVVDSKGQAQSAYSDSDGNFWLTDPGGLTGPYYIGARSGTATTLMVTHQSDLNCSTANCHGTGGVGPVHVP